MTGLTKRPEYGTIKKQRGQASFLQGGQPSKVLGFRLLRLPPQTNRHPARWRLVFFTLTLIVKVYFHRWNVKVRRIASTPLLRESVRWPPAPLQGRFYHSPTKSASGFLTGGGVSRGKNGKPSRQNGRNHLTPGRLSGIMQSIRET